MNVSSFKLKNIFVGSTKILKIHKGLVEFYRAHIHKKVSGREIVLTDSLQMPLESLKIYGRSTQKCTEGKNLWSLGDITFTSNKTITLDQPLPAGDYMFLSDLACNDTDADYCLVVLYNQSEDRVVGNMTINHGTKQIGRFVTDGIATTLFMYASASAGTSNGDTATLTNVCLVQGLLEEVEYEPYTGGKPSPNPAYPQKIENVGDSGSTTIGLCGKNLFDISKVGTHPESLINNGDGTLTVNMWGIYGLSENNQALTLKDLCPLLKTGDRITFSILTDGNEAIYLSSPAALSWFDGETKVITEDMINAVVSFYSKSQTEPATIQRIQFELGDEVTTWEPYKSQLLPLSLENGLKGIPVSSGGNYTDENGQQYMADYVELYGDIVGKNMFDGSESVLYSLIQFVDNSTWAINVMNNKVRLSRIDNDDTWKSAFWVFNNYPTVLGSKLNTNVEYTFSCETDGVLNPNGTGTGDVDIIVFLNYADGTNDAFGGAIYENKKVIQIIPRKEVTTFHIRTDFFESGITRSFYNFQLEQSSTATDYEPYIEKYSGKLYKYSCEITLDGSEYYLPYPNTNGFMAKDVLPEAMVVRNGYCTHFNVSTVYGNANGIWIGTGYRDLILNNISYFDDSLEDKGLANFKAYLTENPVKILTYTTTPTITELTEEQVQAFLKLRTYSPTTRITNTDNAHMEIEYGADATI